MTDTVSFVPLTAPALKPAPGSDIKLLSETPDKAAFETLIAHSADPARSPDPCAAPAVTLKREGDVVTGIRVQCGCGRVLDLKCVY